MGRNNRARRKAKQNRRPRGNASRRDHSRRIESDTDLTIEERVWAAVNAPTDHECARHIARLSQLPVTPVASYLTARLEAVVADLWERGWQPADLDRLVRKKLGKSETAIVSDAIAAQAATYDQLGRAMATEWMDQLEEVGAERWWEPGRSWMEQVDADWLTTLSAAVAVLSLITRLPELPVLYPPPSRWATMGRRRRAMPSGRIDSRVLERIRALLAKAESTEFEAEAEAFTAKAQEMMTRHRIDRATVATPGEDTDAVGRRLGVDNPYAKAKAALIGGIALANACRAVYTPDLGFCTVFGLPEDIEGVDELYTSLLVQATSAVRREGSRADRYGRSRTTSFRRSFYFGFADRIADRLQQAAEDTVQQAETETGLALVPLLAARERAAEEAMRATVPGARAMSTAVSDAEGYWRGIEAADAARLDGPAGRLTG